MIRTRVGYTGGSTPQPTYRNLADHTESIQIDYDPDILSYDELLDVFWKSHRPDRPSRSRQYMSAIFFGDDKQKSKAQESKRHAADRLGRPVFTQILRLETFTQAEEYHQKYYLRGNRELMREFQAMYPLSQAFIDSTAAARANGYLGGNGDTETLEEDLARLGLSPPGRKVLAEIFRMRTN